MTVSRAEQRNEVETGILPHEVGYVLRALEVAVTAKRSADKAYGEAVANSGGDWAFDDSASRASAEAGNIEDKRVARQRKLTHVKRLDYPSPTSTIVEIGSRVTLRVAEQEEVYDIASRLITGMPSEEGIDRVSAQTPFGSALLGRTIDSTVSWTTPRGETVGTITDINQEAVRNFFNGSGPGPAESLEPPVNVDQ